jgi:tRNA threonylcarbamoyladenosine dehydratase
MSKDSDFDRRFSGVRRLYGDAGLTKLQSSHVVVVGIGGVGSWVAEALARNAVGKLTLIDLDNIAESNVNRQIHALEGNFGKAKVTAMRERLLQINPNCTVYEIEDFITPDNIASLLDFQCDVVVDCSDDAKAKIALANYCKLKSLPIMMSGSAGGRLDPTRMEVADLANVQGDKLLAKVRNQLRRNHGFPKNIDSKKPAKFGVQCVYSNEPVIKPDEVCETEGGNLTGLNCAGYGSSVCVTATFGFALAQRALNRMLL